MSGAKVPDCLQVTPSWCSDQAATKPATETNSNGNKKRSARELKSVEQVRCGACLNPPRYTVTCDV